MLKARQVSEKYLDYPVISWRNMFRELIMQLSKHISPRYLDYPVISWRNMFRELHNQLSEFDGDILEDEDHIEDLDYNKNKK